MAQTVAAQRGTTTVTTNGQTATTIFTQSSGTATRVILNSISWRSLNGGISNRMALTVDVNNSGNETCVAFIHTADCGSAGQGLTMFPNSSLFPISSTTTSAATYADGWIINAKDNYYLGTKINSNNMYFLSGPNGSGQSNAYSFNFNFVPSQFWMNSGDVLKLRVFHGGTSETANVVYSFTTVTES